MSQSPLHSNTMQVRHALWNLQKEVLTSLKEEFDNENGYEAAPTEWLQALMGAERYVWLRELTSLMADIDILTELNFITDQHAAIARNEIERLLFNEATDAHFNKHYRDLLMSGEALLPLHSLLKSHLQNLPSESISKNHALAERRAWQEEHRHQSRAKRN